MIGYVTMGTSDFERSLAFFDAFFAEFGGQQMMKSDRLAMYGKPGGAAMFAICKPYNEEPAQAGNGAMVALSAADKAEVDAMHAKALALGATCDGPPGDRGPSFYGAYFRDFNGNKFCSFVFGA